MRPLPVEPLEAAPPFVRGLAIVRGEAMPVVELAKLFGEAPAPAGRFVTLNTGRRRVALAVDDVIGVRAIDPAAAACLPPLLRDLPDLVATIGALDGELLVVLNGTRVLAEDVLAALPTRIGQ